MRKFEMIYEALLEFDQMSIAQVEKLRHNFLSEELVLEGGRNLVNPICDAVIKKKEDEELMKTLLEEARKASTPAPRFNGKRVPVYIAAQVLGMAPQALKVSMQQGNASIGWISRNEEVKKGAKEYNYYISPKLLYEKTGYVYEPALEEYVQET